MAKKILPAGFYFLYNLRTQAKIAVVGGRKELSAWLAANPNWLVHSRKGYRVFLIEA